MEPETSELTVIRPASTGWIVFAGGAFFAGMALYFLISAARVTITALTSPAFVGSMMVFFIPGVLLMIWGWRLAHNHKVMMVLGQDGVRLGRMYSDALVSVGWEDLAGFEIWRPYATAPGQRDQVAFGLTDDAAVRLGLQEEQPDPDSPGHTGRAAPFRKHFTYNAGQLSISADDLRERVIAAVKGVGKQVDGPRELHLGVAARFRWMFSDP